MNLIKVLVLSLTVAVLNGCSSAKEASGTDEGPTPNPPPNSQSATLPVPEVLNIAAAGTGCPGGNISISKKSSTGEIEVSMPDLRAEADSDAGVPVARSNCALSLEAVTTSPSPVRLEVTEATLEIEPELVVAAQSVASIEVFQSGVRGDIAEAEIRDPSVRGVHHLRTRDLILSSECTKPLVLRVNSAVRVNGGVGALQALKLRLKFREIPCS